MRIALRIDRSAADFVFATMWINGGKAAGELVIRMADIVSLVVRLDPDVVECDRENVSQEVLDRLQGFKALVVL